MAMASQACQQTHETNLSQAGKKRRHQLRGGFECIFVKNPPEQVQTECSVCLCVLREPYLLDCCGYSFCRSCIEPIKAERKPCPLCAVHFTTCIPDKRLQRTLNDFQVFCSHKEGGCEWAGQLGSLAQHLNANPLGEDGRLLGCQLTSLECKHCGECFQRRELVGHETNLCSQRLYSCEYCCDFDSTFEDVTSNHFPVCPDRPLPCPNGCGLSLLSKLLQDHLNECPLEVIECAFSYAGCGKQLPRNDMSEHIAQSFAMHMSLQSISHQQEVAKLKEQISQVQDQYGQLQEQNGQLQERCEHFQECYEQLEEQYKESRAEVAELRRANQNLVAEVGEQIKKAQDQRLKGHLSTLRGEIKKAQTETKEEITKERKSDMAALYYHAGLVPFCVTMTGFELKKRLNLSWYSPPFYTHPRGYRMCLNVDANGDGDGEGSHVSVFVCMMKGEYDDYLKWPFQGCITIQLLNQSVLGQHQFSVLNVTDGDISLSNRVRIGERSSGLGFHEFIRHRDLAPLYLKDDCLKFCIKEVNLK